RGRSSPPPPGQALARNYLEVIRDVRLWLLPLAVGGAVFNIFSFFGPLLLYGKFGVPKDLAGVAVALWILRSEEHTSELQSPDHPSFPTRRSSDLRGRSSPPPPGQALARNYLEVIRDVRLWLLPLAVGGAVFNIFSFFGPLLLYGKFGVPKDLAGVAVALWIL